MGGKKSIKPYLLNQMQLGTLLEQGMLVYIGLLYVSCKVVKTCKNFRRPLPVLHIFCVTTFVYSEGWCWLAQNGKLQFQDVKIKRTKLVIQSVGSNHCVQYLMFNLKR